MMPWELNVCDDDLETQTLLYFLAILMMTKTLAL